MKREITITPSTPKSITADIRRIEKRLNVGEPQFVTIAPVIGCEADCCKLNVDLVVRSLGGRKRICWAIWEHADFLEAEFHVVWEMPAGGLVDVTPDRDGETRRLIMLDDNRQWSDARRRSPFPNHHFSKILQRQHDRKAMRKKKKRRRP